MRDHPWHGAVILGGMWGVRNNLLSNMKNLIDTYIKGNFWQVDQNFLRDIIYPIVQNDVFVHDEFFTFNTNKKPFPTKRKGQQFVGEAFDCNDNPNMEHRNMLPYGY
jgi:hypothetical protein